MRFNNVILSSACAYPCRSRLWNSTSSPIWITDLDRLLEEMIAKGDDHPDVRDERMPYWAELWPDAIALASWNAAENGFPDAKKSLLDWRPIARPFTDMLVDAGFHLTTEEGPVVTLENGASALIHLGRLDQGDKRCLTHVSPSR
ncbi:MAG: hypothetical protein ACI9QL_001338 [Candidatus Omnitrophota bacterium]